MKMKRLFSLLLSVSLVLGLLPVSAAGITFPSNPAGPQAGDHVQYLARGSGSPTYASFERGWNEVAAAGGGTITLIKDVTASGGSLGSGSGFRGGAALVPRGCPITLELNGHTVDRALQTPSDNGSVLIVEGELTLQDRTTEQRGAIMGGSSTNNGGGISVRSGGVLHLKSGSVLENASQTPGGGIYNAGTVHMSGGKVSDNRGGGVYQGGLFQISGAAKIAGNSGSANIYLPAGRRLTSGGLNDLAKVGLTAEVPPAAGGSVEAVNGSVSNADTKRVVSDQPSYYIALENETLVLKNNAPAVQPPAGTGTQPEGFDPLEETQGTTGGAAANSSVISVTFHLNGGTGMTPSPISVTPGAPYGASGRFPADPKQAGYTFDGWYTAQSGGTLVTAETIVPENAAPHHLYAHWSAAQLYVTFDPTGGTVSPTQKLVTRGAVYGTLPTPVREGFDFIGWATKPTGGKMVDHTTIVVEEYHHTLYAVWAEKAPTGKQYLISFHDFNTETQHEAILIDCTDPEGKKVLPTPAACGFDTPEGQEFDGWAPNRDGSGQKLPAGATHTFTANSNLYTTWKAHQQTAGEHLVTYLLDGAADSVTEYRNTGEVFSLMDNPSVRSGYRFTGWNYNGQLLAPGTAFTMPDGDVTLTAQWEPDTSGCTVTLDENYPGAPAATTIQAIPGDAYGPLPFPTREGYLFNGWFTEAAEGMGIRITAKDIVRYTEDHTLYAHWSADASDITENADFSARAAITVSFAKNDGSGALLPDTLQVQTGQPYGGPLPQPARPFHTFRFWTLSPTGGDADAITESTLVTETNDHTLYAQWALEEFAFTYHENHGGNPKTATFQYTYGEHTLESFQALAASHQFQEPADQTFDGWAYRESNGNEVPISGNVYRVERDTTVYARWKPKPTTPVTVAVTFDENYDNRPALSTVTATVGQTYAAACTGGKLPVPAKRQFYIFKGWSLSKDGGTGQEVTAVTKVQNAQPHTLYAQWELERFALTYNENHGAFKTAQETYPANTRVTLPSFETLMKAPHFLTKPEGKVFEGWKYQESNGNWAYPTDNVYTIRDDTTVMYARWRDASSYTLTLDPGEGEGTSVQISIPEDRTFAIPGNPPLDAGVTPPSDAFPIPDTAFTREGYAFYGWRIPASADPMRLYQKGETYRMPSSDLTLVAQWKSTTAAPVTVTFDENYEGKPSPITRSATVGGIYGDAFADGKLPVPVRSDSQYTFLGWYTAPAGGTVVTAETIVTNETDHTLYALWKRTGQYQVTFDPNEGGGERSLLLTDTSGELTLPTPADCGITPPEGKSFAFWSALADGTGDKMLPGEVWEFDTDETLYAIWTNAQYTITFHANGGTGTMEPRTVNVGESFQLPSCGFTAPSGKRFDRWAIGSAGSKDTALPGASRTFTADTAIYALWETRPSGPSSGDAYHPSRPGGSSGSNGSSSSKAQVIMNASAGTGGSISPSGQVRVEKGRSQTFTITAQAGYIISDVLVDGESMGPMTSYTFENVQRAHSIQAVFTAAPQSAQPPAQTNAGPTGYLNCQRDAYCPISAYGDVQPGAWYHDGIHYCLDQGLMTGTDATHFQPTTPLTRAMLAQILYNREGRPAVSGGGSGFSDVAEGAWYEAAVKYAAASGLAAGYENGAYGPNDPITREQLVVVLWRHAGSPASGIAVPLSDFHETRAYADEAMRWAFGRGIISGKDNGLLDPSGRASRAEVAQMLKSYFDTIV